MRIGILADVHGATIPLRSALAHFRQSQIERIVNLGDIVDRMTQPMIGREIAQLLTEVDAAGVWGNHDYSLRHEMDHEVRTAAHSETLAYMQRMEPHLTIAGCRFRHREPSVDATDYEAMWRFDGFPESGELSAAAFRAAPEKLLILGHYHDWHVLTPAGPVAWNGRVPLKLESQERYFIVVAPVIAGWCAVLDTDAGVLTPLRCSLK